MVNESTKLRREEKRKAREEKKVKKAARARAKKAAKGGHGADDAERPSKRAKKSKSNDVEAHEGDGFISLGGARTTTANGEANGRHEADVTHISGSNDPSGGVKRKRDDNDAGEGRANPNETEEERAARRKEHNKEVKATKKAKKAHRNPLKETKDGREIIKPKRNPLKYSKEGRAILKEQKKLRLTGANAWSQPFDSAPVQSTPIVKVPAVQAVKEDGHDEAESASSEGKDKNRFICFIGQLPHSATVESVQKHFAKVQPTSVRVPTDKKTGEGKGYAFIEFEDYDRMKTCLKLYHHSSFEDGKNKPRKINVDLTAGGGGSKSSVRKLRIEEKNMKLAEERKRRIIAEQAAETNKEKKEERLKKKQNRNGGKDKGEKDETVEEPKEMDTSGIHPARLAMLKR